MTGEGFMQFKSDLLLIIRLSIILMISMFCRLSFSQVPSEYLEARLEKKVFKIVRAYDELAVAVVKVSYSRQAQVKLPASPFIISNKFIQEQPEKVRSILITIISVLDISDGVKKIISDSTTIDGVVPKIEFKEFPKGFLPQNEKVDYDKLVDKLIAGWWSRVEERSPAIIGGSAFIGFVILFFGIMAILSGRKRLNIMDKSIKSLVGAIQDSGGSGGGGAGLAASYSSQLSPGLAPLDQRAGEAADEVSAYLNELSMEGLIALLMDCYWSREDSYAAFVWNRLKLERREAILGSMQDLDEYILFLSGISEVDRGYASDPYFITPLAINESDNVSLTEAIRSEPSLLNRISSIRLQYLDLSASERISLRKDAEGLDAGLASPRLEKSEPRDLRRKMVIKVNSIEEEQRLASMDEIDLETKEEVQTLIWAEGLSDPDLESILNQFSARDLAEAWVGPEDLLSKFSKMLPLRKLQLLENYLKKDPGSRNSQSYLAMHKMIVAYLRQAEHPEVREQVSAA